MKLNDANVVAKAIEGVEEFNILAGNLDNVDVESVINQLAFIQEEVEETFRAIEEDDDEGVLDGVCDMFVTVAGLYLKMYKLHPSVDREGVRFPYAQELDIRRHESARYYWESVIRYFASQLPDKQSPQFLVSCSSGLLTLALDALQSLETRGFNVVEALNRVNANNMSKFPEQLVYEDSVDWTCEYNEKFQRWVLKDDNGKVRKPRGFKPVSLEGCLP